MKFYNGLLNVYLHSFEEVGKLADKLSVETGLNFTLARLRYCLLQIVKPNNFEVEQDFCTWIDKYPDLQDKQSVAIESLILINALGRDV